MDNEKLFEFMEKMYSEMQQGFKKVEGRFDKIEGRLDKVEGRLDKIEKAVTNLEYEFKETKKTLYDGYIQNAEGIKRIEIKLDEISDKVDKHDIKIQVIEGGKKAL